MSYYDADDEDDDDNQIRCANCGKWIPAVVSRCPACRFDFRGEAQDFEYETDEEIQQQGLPMWVIITAVVLLAMMISGVFSFSFW